ncbi:hypothetical protein ACFL6P_00375 [Candidatus Latescibacterota bacterium]
MKKITAVIFISIFFMAGICVPESRYEDIHSGRSVVRLDGKTASVAVDLGGGGIVDFRVNGSNLNPFTWNHREKGDLSPERIGQFVCFDHLGRPSQQEVKNGMPGHGEAPYVHWTVLSDPYEDAGAVTAIVQCELPLGGMKLERTLSLSSDAAVVNVVDDITNVNKLGRIYNIVQHPTVGAPFLDTSVMIDTNGTKGFASGNPMPAVEEPVVYWPKMVFQGALVDVRRFTDLSAPPVVNYAFEDDEEYGWITACNPGAGFMLGYFWKLSDYPWIRIWKHFEDGSPAACGLEFGTTPLPLPFKEIVAKGSIFGLPTYEYIDAGESRTKSFSFFLAEIPDDYRGASDIAHDNGILTITEHGEHSRDITVKIE